MGLFLGQKTDHFARCLNVTGWVCCGLKLKMYLWIFSSRFISMVADVDVPNASGFFFALSWPMQCLVSAVLAPQLKLFCFPLTSSIQFSLCSDSVPCQVCMCVCGEHKEPDYQIAHFPFSLDTCLLFFPTRLMLKQVFRSLGQTQMLALQSDIDPSTSSICVSGSLLEMQSRAPSQTLPWNLHFLKTPGGLVKCQSTVVNTVVH